MKTVNQDEFDSFIRSFQEDDLICGRDVGRMHGMAIYQKSGKVVAEERWTRESLSHPRIWTYQIAK